MPDRKRDYFDEVADMMAASLTVGQFCGREEIITKLRAKYKTEAELRKVVEKLQADALLATGDPNTVMLVPVKDHPGEFFLLRNEPTKH